MINENPTSPLKKSLDIGILAAAALGLSTQASEAAAGSLHTLTLRWDAVPEEVQGYRIYQQNNNGAFVAISDNVISLSYSIGSLEYGKTYYFAVGAISESGLEGELSEGLAVTVSKPPLPVLGRLAPTPSGAPALQWSFPEAALSTAPSFKIYASSDLLNWTLIQTIFPEEAAGTTAGNLDFIMPIQTDLAKRFYKMTSSNWLGDASAP
ncbi:MAG: fibronectin type III domain-containing protein [Akkermansiaceae bacterium]